MPTAGLWNQPTFARLPTSKLTCQSAPKKAKVQEYDSCFISYSSEDEMFAHKLQDDLSKQGVVCWFAPKDMKIGAKIRPTLDDEIKKHSKLLLVLSKHSINSEWVEQEVETALAQERRRKALILLPIRIDDAVLNEEAGWPALVHNTRHIGDFQNWQDGNDYRQSFSRLMRDLRIEEQQAHM